MTPLPPIPQSPIAAAYRRGVDGLPCRYRGADYKRAYRLGLAARERCEQQARERLATVAAMERLTGNAA